jgi:hypothetical protein
MLLCDACDQMPSYEVNQYTDTEIVWILLLPIMLRPTI